MQEDMKITIIIPVYNGAKYLESCIDSCLNQSYNNIEILLINDGSTDSSEHIITKYETLDHRVKHITQQNQGLVKSRKNGIKHAHTDFVLFLDADDFLTPDAIQTLVQAQVNTDADIIFANFIVEFESGKVLSYSNNKFYNSYEPVNVLNNILLKNIAPTIWGKLIRKDLYTQIDVPDNITIGEDAIAITNLLLLNPKVTSVDANIYHYIQREGSMVNTKNKYKNQQRLIFMSYYRELLLKEFGQSYEIKSSLKHFLIGEVFDVLRDGGEYEDIEGVYKWITKNDRLRNYKSTIGLSRIILIKSFVVNEVLGRWVSFGYNRLRMIRNKLFPYSHR